MIQSEHVRARSTDLKPKKYAHYFRGNMKFPIYFKYYQVLNLFYGKVCSTKIMQTVSISFLYGGNLRRYT
jgi:hypothetical protein